MAWYRIYIAPNIPVTLDSVIWSSSSSDDLDIFLSSYNAYGDQSAFDHGTPFEIVSNTEVATTTLSASSQSTGYDFLGWYTLESDTYWPSGDVPASATVLVESNATITGATIQAKCKRITRPATTSYIVVPKFTPKQGVLAYNVNGGGTISPDYKIVPVDEAIGDLPTPTRTGYQFSGWFTAASGGTRVTSSTPMPQSAYLIIYAHWTPVSAQHTLYFNANGGEVSEASRLVYSGAAYGTLPTPTWAYHTFVGWFTEPYGGAQVSAATTMGDDNATIYAHWTDDTTTVTFNGNGGEPSTQTITYPSGSRYGSLPSATRSGYILAGWFTATTGGTRVEPGDMVSAQPLYAQWQTSGGTAEGVIWSKDADFVVEMLAQ